MIEAELKIEEAFTKGLRPFENLPINSQVFVELLNARVTEVGLEPFEPILQAPDWPNAVSWPPVSAWPYPQYWALSKFDLITTDRFLYEKIGGVYVQVADFGGPYYNNALWRIADFGDFLAVVKGNNKVWERDPAGGWGGYDPHTSIPYCSSICATEGQLVACGLKNWGDWVVDTSHIAWSAIGDKRFTIGRNNEAGFRRAHFNDKALEVKRLGDQNVVVYGYNGIGVLKPGQSTFGYYKVADFGIFESGSVGGNDKAHIFITLKEKELYALDENFTPKNLGYKEFLSALATDYIIISHVPERDDYYISNGVQCYLFTGVGLSRVYQLVSSAQKQGDCVYGTFGTSGESEFLAVTGPFDMQLRGRKSIETVELDVLGSGSFSVAIDYKYNPNDVFQTTGWFPVNNEGVAYPRCSAVEFRFRIKCDDFTKFTRISRMSVRYKFEDRRAVRGIYPQAKGTTVSE